MSPCPRPLRFLISLVASPRVLALWIKPDDLANIVEALELNTAPEPTRLRRVLAGSDTSALLFRELGLQVAYTEYLVLIKGKLNDLEHLDFAAGETDSFRKVLSAETKTLMESGHRVLIGRLPLSSSWAFRSTCL